MLLEAPDGLCRCSSSAGLGPVLAVRDVGEAGLLRRPDAGCPDRRGRADRPDGGRPGGDRLMAASAAASSPFAPPRIEAEQRPDGRLLIRSTEPLRQHPVSVV